MLSKAAKIRPPLLYSLVDSTNYAISSGSMVYNAIRSPKDAQGNLTQRMLEE
jgi:hypothetical protein